MTAAALVGLTACGSTHAPSPAAPTPNAGTTTATSPSGAAPTITDWPTYHGSNDRRGDADVAALTAPLRRAWSLAVDGALYAQPLVVHGVAIVATENDSVYAVGVATGAVPCRRRLPPGAATGPGGDVYVATGNGAEVGGHYDDSDSVLRLTPTLHRIALFAPASWSADNAQDLDLGSMSPALVGTGVVIAGKRGDVYL